MKVLEPAMTCDHKVFGFTLVEVVAILAILAILTATLVPLTNQVRIESRSASVISELREIQEALETYYYTQADFPANLTDAAFLGPYLFPGVDNDTITDEFNPGSNYSYSISGTPSVATISSVGPDGEDDSLADDDIWIQALSEIPGRRRTRYRMDIISSAAARFFYDRDRTPKYYHTTGTWTGTGNDRDDMLLHSIFDTDGWGNDLVSFPSDPNDAGYDPTNLLIFSQGPDGTWTSGIQTDEIYP